LALENGLPEIWMNWRRQINEPETHAQDCCLSPERSSLNWTPLPCLRSKSAIDCRPVGWGGETEGSGLARHQLVNAAQEAVAMALLRIGAAEPRLNYRKKLRAPLSAAR